MQQDLDRQKLASLREQLENRREDLVSRRQTAARSREQLGARESEPEEQAQAATRGRALHSMDQQSREELWEIDAALARIDLGSYGLCSDCGQTITTRRLQAVPWTRYCMGCAEQGLLHSQETAVEGMNSSVEGGTPPAALPEEYQGLEEEDFRQLLLESLAQDDRFSIQELQPSLKEGRLVLQGAVASESDRQLLMQVLHDEMGFSNIRDLLQVDALLSRREAPVPPAPENVPRTEEQELLQGESGGEDLQRAVQEGGSILPPDRFKNPDGS